MSASREKGRRRRHLVSSLCCGRDIVIGISYLMVAGAGVAVSRRAAGTQQKNISIMGKNIL